MMILRNISTIFLITIMLPNFVSYANANVPELLRDSAHIVKDPSIVQNKDINQLKGKIIKGAPVAGPLDDVLKLPDITKSEIERFCGNTVVHASDTRSLLYIQRMIDLRKDIQNRLKELDVKQQEYKIWLDKRDKFLDMVKTSLVTMISKMKPDAAAQQLALMDSLVAASLIVKLNPRISSAIMNQMPAGKGAELASILVSAQNQPVTSKNIPDNSKQSLSATNPGAN